MPSRSPTQTSPEGVSQDPTSKDYLDRPPPKLTGPLSRAIEEQWGSLTTFKSAMSSAALGMASSGYVWLVVDSFNNLGIVPTFGAGTVLVQNRRQRGPVTLQGQAAQTLDENAAAPQSSEDGSAASSPAAAAAASSPSPAAPTPFDQLYSGASTIMTPNPEDRVGETLTPLLCLSGYEHAWLPDWGVWGKETYLARFWEVVDWGKVEGIWQAHRDAGAAEMSWTTR